MTIGVLALQGDYEKHQTALKSLGCASILVRYQKQLNDAEALIIPGGESTAMTILMKEMEFYDPIKKYSEDHPIFGTCAGLILLSTEPNDERVESLDLIDVAIKRNGYGRQVHSGSFEITIGNESETSEMEAIFIRAPKIEKAGPEVEVLGTMGGDPVLVRQGQHLGACFHPELSDDKSIYALFLESIKKKDFAHAV